MNIDVHVNIHVDKYHIAPSLLLHFIVYNSYFMIHYIDALLVNLKL